MTDETVLVAGFSHETNTFAPTSTTRADFQERQEYFGEEVITELRGTNTSVSGGIDVADEETVDLGAKTETSFDLGRPIEGLDADVTVITDGESRRPHHQSRPGSDGPATVRPPAHHPTEVPDRRDGRR